MQGLEGHKENLMLSAWDRSKEMEALKDRVWMLTSDYALEAVFESWTIEIDEQALIDARQAQVSQDLRRVNRLERFHRLDFDDQPALDQQINPIPSIESQPTVANRDRHFGREPDASRGQLCLKTPAVRGLKQSGSQPAMHVNCAANHLVDKRIADEGHNAALLQGRGRALLAGSGGNQTAALQILRTSTRQRS